MKPSHYAVPHGMSDLLKFARSQTFNHVRDAKGMCFYSSLKFALDAQQRGETVQLVRWELVDDDDFCDHWAVYWTEDRVIDLSYRQFSPHSSALVHKIEDYPSNCLRPRVYPAHLLLGRFARLEDLGGGRRLPVSFMIASGWALFKHDLSQSGQQPGSRMMAALYSSRMLMRTAYKCTVSALLERFKERRQQLERRLSAERRDRA